MANGKSARCRGPIRQNQAALREGLGRKLARLRCWPTTPPCKWTHCWSTTERARRRTRRRPVPSRPRCWPTTPRRWETTARRARRTHRRRPPSQARCWPTGRARTRMFSQPTKSPRRWWRTARPPTRTRQRPQASQPRCSATTPSHRWTASSQASSESRRQPRPCK